MKVEENSATLAWGIQPFVILYLPGKKQWASSISAGFLGHNAFASEN